ncbi:hypothetical protein ACFFX0_04720 [Citricoccus parietis]|uniref:Secreted protein n=1 Tax=Citricoccus parietis TaxID=592307 RepID=A0ABV5FV28_9MICC
MAGGGLLVELHLWPTRVRIRQLLRAVPVVPGPLHRHRLNRHLLTQHRGVQRLVLLGREEIRIPTNQTETARVRLDLRRGDIQGTEIRQSHHGHRRRFVCRRRDHRFIRARAIRKTDAIEIQFFIHVSATDELTSGLCTNRSLVLQATCLCLSLSVETEGLNNLE